MVRPDTPPRVRTRAERPATLRDLARVLQETDGTILVRGAGTKLDWAGRVDEPDLVLDTTALTGMLTYHPADCTASMRAGTPLTAVQDVLAEHGQWVSLDPPTAAAGATVGGLFATGDAGPSRLGYGGLRDHVIGVTLVLADGTIARSGGHVIKNVAGYDLAKLVYGSLGTLAVIAEVVIRVHPRPAAQLTVAGPADAAAATAVAQALAASPLEPAAIEWIGRGGGADGRMTVRCDGSAAGVDAAGRGVSRLAAEHGVALEPVSEADVAWAAHAEAAVGHDDETVVRIAGLPAALPALAADLAGGPAHRIVSSVALGLHTVAFADARATDLAAAVTRLRERALARGEAVLLRRRPTALDDLLDPLGPAPSTAPLLRRIAAAFDPTGRLGPGRFRPWY